MMRFPTNLYRTRTQATTNPKNTLIKAAIREAPKQSRRDENFRPLLHLPMLDLGRISKLLMVLLTVVLLTLLFLGRRVRYSPRLTLALIMVFAVDPYSITSMITGNYDPTLSPEARNARPFYHLLPRPRVSAPTPVAPPPTETT